MKTIFWFIVGWVMVSIVTTKISQVNTTLIQINENLTQINSNIAEQNKLMFYTEEETKK